MLWAAWQYGNESPLLLYHFPDPDPAHHPERVKAFIYGCAAFSIEVAAGAIKAQMAPLMAMGKMQGGGQQRRRR